MATAAIRTEDSGNERRHEAFLGVSAPELSEAAIDEVVATLRSGWIVAGPRVEAFERRLAEYLGVEDVCATAGCTFGLLIGLRVSGVGAGDEVLVPAITFVACAGVVEQLGARPVLVDVDPRTGLIDLEAAERAITPRTRAIMPVHLGGRVVDPVGVRELAERHGLAVVEDAAHAIGAERDGRRVGAHGNLTAFSFHATKNMTTIQGGALAVHDRKTAVRVRALRLHGLNRSAWTRASTTEIGMYDMVEPGYKCDMTDVQAAVGLHQLDRLDAWIARRAELAERYDRLLRDLPLDRPSPAEVGELPAHHLYSVRVHRDAPLTRDAVMAFLQEQRIGSSIHFHGIHLMTYYRYRYGIEPADLPVATDWSRRSITLPLFPAMTEADQERVASALTGLLDRATA